MKKSNLLDIVAVVVAFVLLLYSGGSMLILIGRGFMYTSDREAFEEETLNPVTEYVLTIGAAIFCIGGVVIMSTKE